MALKARDRGVIFDVPHHPCTIGSSFKGYALAGSGHIKLEPALDQKPLRWLGRNFVRGVHLGACEVVGHTTFVGCHINGKRDTMKIGVGATVEMIGCVVMSHYPTGVRVGKQATLRATDCDFKSLQVSNELIKACAPGAAEISLIDCRITGRAYSDIHVEVGNMKALVIEGCTFEHVRPADGIESRRDRVQHGVALLRGVPPTFSLKRNHFIDRGLFVNATDTSTHIEGNRFERRQHLTGPFLQGVNGVELTAKDSVLVNIPTGYQWVGGRGDRQSAVIEENTLR